MPANTGQLGIGHYGSPGTGTTSGNASGKNAFVIGNGSTSGGSVSLSNAFRVTYAGAVIGKAAYQSTGADFAELREWSDGNPNGEDRRGYFVTMEGMNIRIASPGDYICGIISANPSVIGNNDEDWMYVMYTLGNLDALSALITTAIGSCFTLVLEFAVYCAKSFLETKAEKELEFRREQMNLSQDIDEADFSEFDE